MKTFSFSKYAFTSWLLLGTLLVAEIAAGDEAPPVWKTPPGWTQTRGGEDVEILSPARASGTATPLINACSKSHHTQIQDHQF